MVALTGVMACAGKDSSPRPIGNWERVATGASPQGSFSVFLASASRGDSVCVSLELEPAPDLGPVPDERRTYEGREYGCLLVPSDEDPARLSQLRLGGGYDVVLALTPPGSDTRLPTAAGGEIPNAASSESSRVVDLYLGFPQPGEDLGDLEIAVGDTTHICELPAPASVEFDCHSEQTP